MSEVLTIGETMAVFIPAEPGSYQYVDQFRLRFAGAESNTAIGLCKLGHSAEWMSHLGDDEFGRFVVSKIRAEGVTVPHVQFNPHAPTGLMSKRFKPSGETEVFYYRSGSAASKMDESLITETLFQDVTLVHMTGITPVLSSSCLRLTRKIYETARKMQVKISFDPNIRLKLWGNEDYKDLLKEFISQSDIVLMGIDEGQILYGNGDISKLRDDIFTSEIVQYLALKNGAVGAYVCSRREEHHIPPYPCRCIDPVGAGDAFNAGFLSGILKGNTLAQCGQIAGIAGALCTQTQGDIEGLPTQKEILGILNHTTQITR